MIDPPEQLEPGLPEPEQMPVTPEATAPQVPATQPQVPKASVDTPLTEDEDLLFGKTMRPDDIPGKSGVRGRRPRPSKNLRRYFDVLAEASREPDAPAELQAFMQVLAYHLGEDA